MSLQREITLSIKIGNVERNYKVKFPTVGQYIQVQSRQAQLAVPKGSKSQSTQYLNMIMQGTLGSNAALDMVEMIAWFEVCIPDLMSNTVGDISNIEDLDIFDVKPLLDAYKNVFLPWKESWEKVFIGIVEKDKEEDKKKDVGKEDNVENKEKK